ncbi:glycosyltransferase family 2 protein [Paramagnetospirillum caucaseum]|uniref:glycosyltransferase family 2 protein n=1 Tax=Paramagnetospirillum caucaseum TaxID=1244869 RepID=UPI0013765431|nr:glycosyltransferase [Paramagnetospirillum caucaseum]
MFGSNSDTASVFCVNDGSTTARPKTIGVASAISNLRSLEIINLVCNLGHQRALAIGLAEIARRDEFTAVIVLDADGEDDPNHLDRIIAAHTDSPEKVIFARRSQRSEGLVFRMFYVVYKLCFQILTGFRISFGNFCLIPMESARRLVFKANLWNSLPATILQSKLPYTTVDSHRRPRICGQSKMGFVGLLLHGFHAISVFSEPVIVRLVLLIISTSSFLVLGIVAIRYTTDILVPGWTSSMIAILVVISLQALFLIMNTTLVVLQNRCLKQMIPAVEFKPFIRDIVTFGPSS